MENKKEIPPHLDKWNWGAFLLSPLWSIRFRVWIGLLYFIPLIGFFMRFMLGFDGSRWAWEKGSFNSEEEFQKPQKRWMIAGFVIWAIIILPQIILLLNSTT